MSTHQPVMHLTNDAIIDRMSQGDDASERIEILAECWDSIDIPLSNFHKTVLLELLTGAVVEHYPHSSEELIRPIDSPEYVKAIIEGLDLPVIHVRCPVSSKAVINAAIDKFIDGDELAWSDDCDRLVGIEQMKTQINTDSLRGKDTTFTGDGCYVVLHFAPNNSTDFYVVGALRLRLAVGPESGANFSDDQFSNLLIYSAQVVPVFDFDDVANLPAELLDIVHDVQVDPGLMSIEIGVGGDVVHYER